MPIRAPIRARLYAREVSQLIEAARSSHAVLDFAAEARRISGLSGVSEALTAEDLVEAARLAGLPVQARPGADDPEDAGERQGRDLG